VEKTIRVTKDDIKRGQALTGKASETCAIARAVKWAFKAKRVIWFYVHGRVLVDGSYRSIVVARGKPTAAEVTAFVKRHDSGAPVKPFVFTVCMSKR
jgi:hypothetical protein